MSKPRKKYRQKYSYLEMKEAANRALFTRSNELVDQKDATHVANEATKAFERMKCGAATPDDFNIVSCAANIALVLCEKGIGAEYFDVCRTASKELARARYRYEEIGRFVLTGVGLRAVAEMIQVREAQLLAEGYTAGIDYQASLIAADRLVNGEHLRPEDLVEAP